MKFLNKIKKSPVVLYTVIFCIFITLMVFYFKFNDRGFIWSNDGMNQHYPILYDFNEIVRGFLKNPFGGINEWSFNIGYGADIVGTYSYYVLGDPFAYLSLLFPMDKLDLAFNIILILRLYIAGLAFMLYAKKMNFSKNSIILGSVSYSLASFGILEGMRHPYFINPLILIPLAFICIENILQNKKKYMLSIIVALAMVSNFYFCYMIAILSVIYAFIRFYDINKNRKIKLKFGKYFLDLLVYFIIGIMISAVFLLPTIYFILSSSRSTIVIKDVLDVFYNIGYYTNLIFTSISPGKYASWTVITAPMLVFTFLPLFFRLRKRYITYFSMTIIFFVMMLFPIFGLVMNGFSTVSNRWTLVFAFIQSVIICVGVDNLINIKKKDIRRSIYIIAFYLTIAIVSSLFPNVEGIFYTVIILGVLNIIFVKIYYLDRNQTKVSALLLAVLIINIGFNFIYRYSDEGLGYINEFAKLNNTDDYYEGAYGKTDDFIKDNDNSFYRISKLDGLDRSKTRNNSIIRNYNGIDSFLSVTNGNLANFSKELGNRSYTPNSPIINFDNRPIVMDMMGVKYIIAKNTTEETLDNKYEKIHHTDKFSVYENKDVLPFGFVYENIFSSDKYNELNAVQKEESLVYRASVDSKHIDNQDSIKKDIEAISNLENIPFNTEKSTAKIKDGKIKVSKGKSKVILEIDNFNQSNLYVRIKGLKFEPIPYDEQLNKKIKALGENKTKKDILEIKGEKLTRFNKGYGYKLDVTYDNIKKTFEQTDRSNASEYFTMDDIVINLGYYDDISDKNIELKFNKQGVYTYDSIEVYTMPLDNYESSLTKLNENSLNAISFDGDKVKGEVNTSYNGVLTFQIPYSKGWTIKIDGKKTNTFPVNTMFLGTNIESGKHNIELTYSTPFLRLGLGVSFIGIIFLVIAIIFDLKYNNKRKF